jgi:hypothetical protein
MIGDGLECRGHGYKESRIGSEWMLYSYVDKRSQIFRSPVTVNASQTQGINQASTLLVLGFYKATTLVSLLPVPRGAHPTTRKSV